MPTIINDCKWCGKPPKFTIEEQDSEGVYSDLNLGCCCRNEWEYYLPLVWLFGSEVGEGDLLAVVANWNKHNPQKD